MKTSQNKPITTQLTVNGSLGPQASDESPFEKYFYKQKPQIERGFAGHKRFMGSALLSRTKASLKRECLYRVFTHNRMILRCA